jgi:hypothetical protein
MGVEHHDGYLFNANANADTNRYSDRYGHGHTNCDRHSYSYSYSYSHSHSHSHGDNCTNSNTNPHPNARLWRHGFFITAKRQYALRRWCRSTQQRSGHLSFRGKDGRQRLAPWIDRVRSQLNPDQCDDYGGEPFNVPVTVGPDFRTGQHLVEQSVERLG